MFGCVRRRRYTIEVFLPSALSSACVEHIDPSELTISFSLFSLFSLFFPLFLVIRLGLSLSGLYSRHD